MSGALCKLSAFMLTVYTAQLAHPLRSAKAGGYDDWQTMAYSAGVGLGGGLVGGAVDAAVLVVAFFSTMRTAMIEPS